MLKRCVGYVDTAVLLRSAYTLLAFATIDFGTASPFKDSLTDPSFTTVAPSGASPSWWVLDFFCNFKWQDVTFHVTIECSCTDLCSYSKKKQERNSHPFASNFWHFSRYRVSLVTYCCQQALSSFTSGKAFASTGHTPLQPWGRVHSEIGGHTKTEVKNKP